MPAIDEAQVRLAAALDRLERAIAQRRTLEPAVDMALTSEVTALRDECADLRERLAIAEARHARLKRSMTDMGGRLDTAIADLDALIEA